MTNYNVTYATYLPLDPAANQLVERVEGRVVRGWATPSWAPVVRAFAQNFKLGELGASFSVVANGHRVVDLWGGEITPKGSLWEPDTLAVFYSCSKILTTLVVHHLIDAGKLSLDAPILDYWPELRAAQAGGTVRMALCHTLGLPAIAHKLKEGAYNDHSYMVTMLESQRPFWEPGTRVGYHPITFGFILGELVKRVSGKTLGQYFKQVFADPLGLDMYIGLPEGHFSRVSPSRPFRPSHQDPAKHVVEASHRIGSVQNLWFFNSGHWRLDTINSAPGLAAEIPAANGVGNARSLAALLGVLLDRRQMLSIGLSDATLARLESVCAATQHDATLLGSTRFSCGMMKSIDNRHDRGADSFIIGRHAFGHVGMGGSFGVCDQEAGFTAAYVMNQQGHGVLLNERGQKLLDACYRVAQFDQITEGGWQPAP